MDDGTLTPGDCGLFFHYHGEAAAGHAGVPRQVGFVDWKGRAWEVIPQRVLGEHHVCLPRRRGPR